MSLKEKLLTTGLVAVMSLGFATGALANEGGDVVKTNDIDITIKSADVGVGGLDLITSPVVDGGFGEIELDANEQVYYASFADKFTVIDLRGTHEGWSLTVEASQFDSGSHTLPRGSLILLDGVNSIERVGTGFGGSPINKLTHPRAIDQGAVNVVHARAGSGMGVFDLSFNNDVLGLIVNATTAKVGNYSSTLTWTLHATPLEEDAA